MLDNAGESLRLVRPGPAGSDGAVPVYRVDRVEYEPGAPWPAVPDTGGVSLERVKLEGYGSDPENWVASADAATPGRLQPNRPPLFHRCMVDPTEGIPRFFLDATCDSRLPIQYADSLGPAVWRLLERIDGAGSGPVEFRDPELPLPHQRFYRVVRIGD